jgi:putative redox protein
MARQGETLIAKCSVHAAGEDLNYRQQVRCGRHEFLVDERPARGGADAGPMPFEYLLAGLGACTSITLRMYAERHGWKIGAVDVSLALRKGDDASRIERRVTVSAPLTPEQQQKLAEICEKTPVTLAVKAGVPVTTTLLVGQEGNPRPAVRE